MRNTLVITISLAILTFFGCKENNSLNPEKMTESVNSENQSIEPFELSISENSSISENGNHHSSLIYNLTNEKLTISLAGDLRNGTDSIIYSTTKLPKLEIRRIAEINIDSLNVIYSTICLKDGLRNSFRFKKNGISKSIRLENYYHTQLSPVIEFINKIVPKKHRLLFNKNSIIEKMQDCGEYEIIKSWNDLKTEK